MQIFQQCHQVHNLQYLLIIILVLLSYLGEVQYETPAEQKVFKGAHVSLKTKFNCQENQVANFQQEPKVHSKCYVWDKSIFKVVVNINGTMVDLNLINNSLIISCLIFICMFAYPTVQYGIILNYFGN